MKKAASIFLIFIYAFTTTGIAVKADYCCNNLKSVKVVLADGAKSKDGCCTVKYQSLKIKDVHSAANVLDAPAVHFSFTQTLNNFFQATSLVSQTTNHPVNIHAPPLIASAPVYISNCVFRI